MDPTNQGSGYADALAIWNAVIALPDGSVNPITLDTDRAYPGETYSFTHKGSLFLGIDEYSAGAKTFDEAFLNDQLSRKAAHKFVFAHQPTWNFKADELGPSSILLANDLQAGGVDLIFSGHIHSYQRIAEKGYRFQELIVGTGSAPQDDYPLVDPTNLRRRTTVGSLKSQSTIRAGMLRAQQDSEPEDRPISPVVG
jgi:hypothetical protein